jgi:hypothetical protein
MLSLFYPVYNWQPGLVATSVVYSGTFQSLLSIECMGGLHFFKKGGEIRRNYHRWLAISKFRSVYFKLKRSLK